MTFGVWFIGIICNLSDLKELNNASIALKILETQYWHSAVPCDKVKQVLELFLRQAIDILPEPSDDLIISGAIGVLNVIFEVLEVNIFLAVDDHVELVGLKDREEIVRNDLVNAIAKVLDHFDDRTSTVMFDSKHNNSLTIAQYTHPYSMMSLCSKNHFISKES